MVRYHEHLSQISMANTYVIAQHCIILLILCLYEILINKRNKISYITMSMPLLYNIEKFNNTVTIQFSLSMHSDVYCILSFSITEGATRTVSSDLKYHFVRPLSSMWRSTVSLHVFASVLSPVAVRICQHGLRKTPVALSYVVYMSGYIWWKYVVHYM